MPREGVGYAVVLNAYLGIDPGESGGMAVVVERERDFPEVKTVPLKGMTPRDRWEWIVSWTAPTLRTVALIEQVGGFIRGNPLTGSSMFTFGKSAGMLEGFLVAAGLRYESVRPTDWQSGVGVPPRASIKEGRKTVWKESDSSFKSRLKAKAQQLFPTLNVTLATADALLIAEHCRRVNLPRKAAK